MSINLNKSRNSIIGVVLGVTIIVPMAIAGALSIPKNWVADETLTAADLNGNFTAVKTEVDDNASDIAILNNTKQSGIVGVQVNDFSVADITVTGTALVELLSISITETGPMDVSLSAHMYNEIGVGGNSLRYEYLLCNTACTCARSTSIGSAMWRPIGATSGLQSVTIPITGIETNVTAPVTYKLCARKFDVTAPDVSIYLRGLLANWSRP